MDEFFRRLGPALRRAFDPVDVHTPRRLWAIRLLVLFGLLYSFNYSRLDESRPINLILGFGSMAILSLTWELKKLWDRVERLEAAAKIGQAPNAGAASVPDSN